MTDRHATSHASTSMFDRSLSNSNIHKKNLKELKGDIRQKLKIEKMRRTQQSGTSLKSLGKFIQSQKDKINAEDNPYMAKLGVSRANLKFSQNPKNLKVMPPNSRESSSSIVKKFKSSYSLFGKVDKSEGSPKSFKNRPKFNKDKFKLDYLTRNMKNKITKSGPKSDLIKPKSSKHGLRMFLNAHKDTLKYHLVKGSTHKPKENFKNRSVLVQSNHNHTEKMKMLN